jgi:acetylornithine deacetylase/succinyl-diaminopimelate desuccinylase-like protein
MKKTQAFISAHQERFLAELLDFLRIPSISADPVYAGSVRNAAEWLASKLKEAGLDQVRLEETAGFPIVYGEKMVDPTAPTILVYGHYDVQPADPLDLWESPPFEPVIKNNVIYARGACDDKGQVFMHVKAFEAMLASGELTCNVKFMIEGEEEVGSDHLGVFVEANKELLKADVILISDTAIIANDIPSIDVGLRGLSYMEVSVQGPNRDLHSGVYGGAVANPINILCQMIASMHDEFNHITIPGFYDGVLELSASDRAAMAQTPFDLDAYQKDLGIQSVHGEKGYSTIERASIRPTLDVNGIWGGYTGEGAKTVLPSMAYAKISMRLVPNQSSETITQLFTDHFKAIAPQGVTVTVKPHHGGEAYIMPTDSIAYQAASEALAETFGKEPVPTRGGGSIPIVALFEKELGIKSILMGFGLDSDAIHSPNEHYGLFNFYKGIETIPHFFANFHRLSQES